MKPLDRQQLCNMMGVEEVPEEIIPVWEKWSKRYQRVAPGSMAVPVEAKLAFVQICEMMGLLDFVQMDQARKLQHNEIQRLHYNALLLIAPEQKNQKAKLARFRGTEANNVLLHYCSRDQKGNEILDKEQKAVPYSRVYQAQEF